MLRSALRSVLHVFSQADGTLKKPRENRAESRLADECAGRGFEKKLACFGWWDGASSSKRPGTQSDGNPTKTARTLGPVSPVGWDRLGSEDGGGTPAAWFGRRALAEPGGDAVVGAMEPRTDLGGCSVPGRLLLMRRRPGERLIEITAHHSIDGRREIRERSGCKVVHTV